MENALYQRPREKLRSSGVSTLSIAELLQVILGSGGPGASGATIARHVEELLIDGTASYDALVAVQGVGDAKACQILAAYELSKRFSTDG